MAAVANESVWVAAHQGHLERVKQLVEAEPRLATMRDEDERYPIHWAAAGGHLNIVEYLLLRPGAGETINAPDERGLSTAAQSHWTPLMIAVSAGHLDVVKALLDAGAAIDVQNENGQTCLHYAASRNRLPIAKLLVDRGAKVDAQDNMGAGPLHRAASLGHVNMVKFLLEQRASVHLLDRGNNTPLHAAMSEGQAEVAALLILDYKADPHLKNKNEKTPIDLASPQVLEALRREGAL